MSDSPQTDQLLDDAARALRDATSGPSAQAAETRARVLAAHRARLASRRSNATAWLAAAAAAMLVIGSGTAWAWWTGRMERWLGQGAPEAPEAVEPPREQPARAAEPRTPQVEATTELPVIAPEPTPEPQLEASAPLVSEDDEARDEAPIVDGARDEEPIDPTERRMYREAHALHFDARDSDSALSAWDRYLAAYPRGRFALEARYNRALCLVRAGRDAEAREALEPFVRGTHGGYRQGEATDLARALDGE